MTPTEKIEAVPSVKADDLVASFVEDYEFAGDGGDYTPTDNERALLIDALHGFIYGLAERGLFTASPPPPSGAQLVPDWQVKASVSIAAMVSEWCAAPNAPQIPPDIILSRLRRFVPSPPPSGALPDAEPVVTKWRELALQFDRHRIEALSLLRGVVAGVTTSEQINAFLASPPSIEAAPVVDDAAWEKVYAEHEGIPAAELAATVARYGKVIHEAYGLLLYPSIMAAHEAKTLLEAALKGAQPS